MQQNDNNSREGGVGDVLVEDDFPGRTTGWLSGTRQSTEQQNIQLLDDTLRQTALLRSLI